MIMHSTNENSGNDERILINENNIDFVSDIMPEVRLSHILNKKFYMFEVTMSGGSKRQFYYNNDESASNCWYQIQDIIKSKENK